MIAVDILELEMLADMLVSTASETDELLSQLQMIYNEMQENPELPNYPQCIPAMESLAASIDSVSQTNDSLQSLKTIMLCAVDEYKDNEKEFREELEKMLSSLNALHIDLASAAAAAEMLPIEKDEEIIGQSKLQQLVADSSSDMQLTNLAAVAKVIEEEYCVTNMKSAAQLSKDLEEQADEVALSSIAADALRIEEEDEISLARNFQSTVAEELMELDSAIDRAQRISTGDVSED